MLQAALRADQGGCRYKGDCKACIDMIKAGPAVATSAKRILARVYAILLAALEDTGLENVMWMPAHSVVRHCGVNKSRKRKYDISRGQLTAVE